jgi:hypothetical protein
MNRRVSGFLMKNDATGRRLFEQRPPRAKQGKQVCATSRFPAKPDIAVTSTLDVKTVVLLPCRWRERPQPLGRSSVVQPGRHLNQHAIMNKLAVIAQSVVEGIVLQTVDPIMVRYRGLARQV